MNVEPMGDFSCDEGKHGERGDIHRHDGFIDNTRKSSRFIYPVDTLKHIAVTQKNLNLITLDQDNSAWNHGSAYKYMSPYYPKAAPVERSTFNSRDYFSASGSSNRTDSGWRSTNPVSPRPPAANETSAPELASVPQEPLPEPTKKLIKYMIDLYLINPDGAEMVAEVKQCYTAQYHVAVVYEILNVGIEKSATAIELIAMALLNLVASNTISAENFAAGIKEFLEFAPDLFIDIPQLYDHLGKIIAPQIEMKHITFVTTFTFSKNIIDANHGPLFLKAIIRELKKSMGPSFMKRNWHKHGLQLIQWMDEKQVAKWMEDNNFEFLSPAQTETELIQLMNADKSCECIKKWIQDEFDNSANADWFMRTLIQSICQHALFGPERRETPHFNRDRMNKYASLIHDFGETKETREASCLFGIQQLIRSLEHPQGLTLEIFEYLYEQDIISFDGFIAWELSEHEEEGKGVMTKALASFFTNTNEDSSSED